MTSNKLAYPAVGTYPVLANNQLIIKIDRVGVTERVPADRCLEAPLLMDAPRASTTAPSDLADKVTTRTHIPVELVSRYANGLRASSDRDLTTDLNADVQP